MFQFAFLNWSHVSVDTLVMPGQSLAVPVSGAEIPLLFMEMRRGQCGCWVSVYSV